MRQWYRNVLSKTVIPRIQEKYDADTLVYETKSTKFSDMFGKNLEDATRKKSVLRIAESNPIESDTVMTLDCIRGKDDHVTRAPDSKAFSQGAHNQNSYKHELLRIPELFVLKWNGYTQANMLTLYCMQDTNLQRESEVCNYCAK